MRAAEPTLAVACTKETTVIRSIAGEGLPPYYRAVSGIYSAEDADITQGVKKARLLLLPRPMEEGGRALGEAKEVVMEVDDADFIAEDGLR